MPWTDQHGAPTAEKHHMRSKAIDGQAQGGAPETQTTAYSLQPLLLASF